MKFGNGTALVVSAIALASVPACIDAQQVVYRTGFETSESFNPGVLAGQGGFIAYLDRNKSAATVSTAMPKLGLQSVRLNGPDFVTANSNGDYSGYFYPQVNYDAVGSGNPVVTAVADVKFISHDSAVPAASGYQLYTIAGDFLGGIDLESDGSIYAYNDASFSDPIPFVDGQWYKLRTVANFSSQLLRFYVDGTFFAELPMPPIGAGDIGDVDLFMFGQGAIPGQESFVDNYTILADATDSIVPKAFTIFRGNLVSGALGSLLDQDNDPLVVRNGPIALPSESPITVVLDGNADSGAPSTFAMRLRARVSIGNLSLSTDFFDWTTNSYVSVDTRSAPTTDTVFTVSAGNPTRFIRSGDFAVRSRVRVRPAGVLFTNAWRLFLDEAVWKITP